MKPSKLMGDKKSHGALGNQVSCEASPVLEKPWVTKGDGGQRIAGSGKAKRLGGDKETKYSIYVPCHLNRRLPFFHGIKCAIPKSTRDTLWDINPVTFQNSRLQGAKHSGFRKSTKGLGGALASVQTAGAADRDRLLSGPLFSHL